MYQPETELLEDVVSEITMLRDGISDAKDRMDKYLRMLNEIVGVLPDFADGPEQLRSLASYIYWNVPEVSPTEIAKALARGGKMSIQAMLKNYIEPLDVTKSCQDCGATVHLAYASRNEMLLSPRLDTTQCEPCRTKEQAAIRARQEISMEEYRQKRLAQLAEWSRLASMPYREYLTTPEWQNTRKKALYRAGYACQVCNAKDSSLNVHHRTYERRGREAKEDLVVLCRGCHELFHREGKLAHH